MDGMGETERRVVKLLISHHASDEGCPQGYGDGTEHGEEDVDTEVKPSVLVISQTPL